MTQNTLENPYTSYEDSGMHDLIKNILWNLSTNKIINPVTQNDKFAAHIKNNFREILIILNKDIFPKYSSGSIPQLTDRSFYISLWEIINKIKEIDKDINNRIEFYTAFFNSKKNLDEFLKNCPGNYKSLKNINKTKLNEIIAECKEKQNYLETLFAAYELEGLEFEDILAVAILPKSEILYEIMNPIVKVFQQHNDIGSILSFYNHVKAIARPAMIVKMFTKHQITYDNTKNIYKFNNEPIDLYDYYGNFNIQFGELCFNYNKYYELDKQVVSSENAQIFNRELDFKCDMPQVNDTSVIENLNDKLKRILHEAHGTLVFSKTKKIHEELDILGGLLGLSNNSELDNLSKYSETSIKNFLRNYYEISETENIDKHFDKLMQIFGFKKYIFNLGLQKITPKSIKVLITKKESECYSLKNSPIELDQQSYTESDGKTDNSEDTQESEHNNITEAKETINLCLDINSYLEEDLKKIINDYSVEDFFTKDLAVTFENSFLETKDSTNKELQEILADLKNIRKYLINLRLNELSSEINNYLNSKLAKALSFKNNYIEILKKIENKEDYDYAAGIKNLTDELSTINVTEVLDKCKSLEIEIDLKIPTAEDVNKLSQQVAALKQFKNRKNVLKNLNLEDLISTYQHDVSRTTFIESLRTSINQYTTDDAETITSLNIKISEGLKRYNNLRLRSCLYTLQANILDADCVYSEYITKETISEKVKLANNKALSDFESKLSKLCGAFDKTNNKDLKANLYNYFDEFLNAENKKKSFDTFKNKVIFRLHSYDFEMAQQDKQWYERKSTIIVALLTLGIALGISYAVTKLTTGHAYLFWEKTHKQEIANEVFASLSLIRP